jgi:AraC-like DNA-binding protein
MAVLTQREQHFAEAGALNRPLFFRDLRVSNAGYFPKKLTWLDERFQIYAVGLVVAGSGSYRVGRGRVQEVRAGSMFTVHPGAVFHYGPDRATGWEEHYVGVVGRGVRRWIRSGLFPTDGIVRSIRNTESIATAMHDILRTSQRGERGDADRAVVMTERLLLELSLSRDDSPTARRTNSAMESVLNHCREHLSEAIDFESLADAHAMSYSHLRQQMRRLTGVAPAHYLSQLRCQRACRLLIETEESIKSIGQRVGIGDPYTFSRTFRRTSGLSPQRYRDQNVRWRG